MMKSDTSVLFQKISAKMPFNQARKAATLCVAVFFSVVFVGCGCDCCHEDCENEGNYSESGTIEHKLAGGGYYSLILSNEGKVYAAGYNRYSALGMGDNIGRISFEEVSYLRDKNIAAIVASLYSSFAISNESKVYTAGFNDCGQLGLGDYAKRNAFTEILDLRGKNIVDIVAGDRHSLVLFGNAKVYTAGLNLEGQLGLGDNETRIVFTEVTDLNDKNITAIAAGTQHSLVISNDGKVYVTGHNRHGGLGLGDNNERNVFTEVTSLRGANITAAAAGSDYTLVLSANGTVYATGYNDAGQLGLGDYAERNVFTEVTSLRDKNITAIAVGHYHSLAFSGNGTVYAAGYNMFGQLGLGDNDNRTEFTEVTDLNDKNITTIAAGATHTLALSANGTIYVVGENQEGQLGLGFAANHNTFVEVTLP
ncbi:MAG: hypothetical protein LBP40_03280 [Campylobacteraceae bacterium]|nr:hypothetical protein [Campylobacteraceae bacterium]